MIVCGAGISVACGIPDFRSPGTGLYSQLSAYNLPEPTSMFDIDYFCVRPRPFYTLTQQIYPSSMFKPSYTHCFFKLLQDHGKLSYIVTQNIDDIEKHVGVDRDHLSQAHGSFTNEVFCVGCNYKSNNTAAVQSASLDGAVPHCPNCGRLLKPGIVFFGEALPPESAQYGMRVRETDLMLVMGTSLQVAPVNQFPILAYRLGKQRILVNNVVVGDFDDIDEDRKQLDTVLVGDCDSKVKELCKGLGWLDELEKIYKQFNEQNLPGLPKPSQDLKLIALSNSLVVPDALTTTGLDLSSTVQFGGKVMFALASDEQINILEKLAQNQEIKVDKKEIPQLLLSHYKNETIKLYDKVVKFEDQIVYSPIGGHFASYLTSYVRCKKLCGEDSVWDLITRYQGTNTSETNDNVRVDDESIAQQVNKCFVSPKDLDRFIYQKDNVVESIDNNVAQYELYTIANFLPIPHQEQEQQTTDKIEVKFKLAYDEDDDEAVKTRFNEQKELLMEQIKDVVRQTPINVAFCDKILTLEFGKPLHGDGFEVLRGVIAGFWRKQSVTVRRPQ